MRIKVRNFGDARTSSDHYGLKRRQHVRLNGRELIRLTRGENCKSSDLKQDLPRCQKIEFESEITISSYILLTADALQFRTIRCCTVHVLIIMTRIHVNMILFCNR
jgi:hypothetical protein